MKLERPALDLIQNRDETFYIRAACSRPQISNQIGNQAWTGEARFGDRRRRTGGDIFTWKEYQGMRQYRNMYSIRLNGVTCGASCCVTRSEGEGEDVRRKRNKSAAFTHSRFYHSSAYCTSQTAP